MKRFLIIFGICFGSLVVFLGGYLGIKYLIGDFEPEIILPENIAFEQSEYYLEDGQNSTITITTTTEGVTETNVSLSLSKNCRETTDKKHWTDGIIIVPKVAELGVPFTVELVKDDTYADELASDSALSSWVVGGVSKIIATSENDLIRPATTTTYVDVPVYKTEVIVFNGETTKNLTQTITNIEHSELVTSAQDLANVLNINAGEKFYLGIKFYPSASAVRYSKVSSTNLLVEYKTQILEKLESLGLTSLYTEFESVFNNNGADANSVIEAYKAIAQNSGNSDLNTYLQNLSENYYKNLKYFNIVEKNTGSANKAEFGGRVLGTNIYEYTATQNLGNVEYYSYVFKKSGTQDIAFELMEDGDDVLQVLENEYQNQNVIKNTAQVNIVDVEVDTMELGGSMADFYSGVTHVIYASKLGINSETASHLNIKLSNSNIPNVNLENSISNVGIRFEVKQAGSNYWVDASDIIKIKNPSQYKTITYAGNNYFTPKATANYWEVYNEEYVEGTFRVVVKYFTEQEQDGDKVYSVVTEIAEGSLPQFTLLTKEENMVSWTDASAKEMQIINMSEVLKADGTQTTVQANPEFDLASVVDRDTVNQNIYTTIRYFIYSDGNEDLSTYFDTMGKAVTYNLSNGNINLYELPSSVIKLKDIEKVPAFTVKAIFMTIKTDINGAPIMDGDMYTYVKYSAVKEGSLEELSSKEFKFVKSLSKLTGTISILDETNADVVTKDETNIFLVAHDTNNVLSVSVKCEAKDKEIFDKAISDGNITVVAKTSTGSAENYIELGSSSLTNGAITFNVSTIDVSSPIDVSIYVVYTIAGNNYMFKALHTHDGVADAFDRFTIESEVNNSASFAIYQMAGQQVDYTSMIDMDNLDYIEISTVYDDAKNSIDRVYKIFYVDNDEGVEINKDQAFDENGHLRILVKNFLNLAGDAEDAYYMSDNSSVVLIENGKIITYVGNGTANISLYLNDDVTKVQDTIKIVVNNEGYISKYAFSHDGWTGVREFDQDNPYISEPLTASVNGQQETPIYLEDNETDASKNTALFALWYMVSQGVEKKLDLTVRLDVASLDNFNAITGKSLTADDLILTDNITITKDIGESLSIQLYYEWGNIVQKINLNITAVTSVSSFKVFDGEGKEIPADNSVNSQYTVYSGYGYSLQAEINKNNLITPYYYVLNSGNLEPITLTSNIVKIINGKFYFDDAEGQKSYQICVSNKPSTSAPTIGDLKYLVEFVVNTNVKIAEDVVAGEYRIAKEANKDGVVVLDLTQLYARKFGNYELVGDFARVTAETGVGAVVDKSLQITITNVVNLTTRSFTLSYAGYTLNTITVVITPYNYENSSSNYQCRLAKYNGERAIILSIGDSVTSNRPDMLADLFNGARLINLDTNTFAEYVLVVNNTVTAPANNLFVDTTCYVDVYDNNNNVLRYKLIISQLAYPFVTFNFADENYSSKDLDVYKLFSSTSLDKEEMGDYYKSLGISASLDYNQFFGGGDVISLLSDNGNDSIFNFATTESDVSFGVSLIGDGNVTDYVTYDSETFTITTKDIGKEFILLHVVLRKTRGSYTYTIPAIIKVQQSQTLRVVYPYDSTDVSGISGYGTDEYDNINMQKATTPFGNAIMEYVEFKTSGIATLDLTSQRFVVSKLVDDGEGNKSYQVDASYGDDDFEFEISKVYVKLSSSWELISSANMANYVKVSGNTVTFTKGGAVAIRAKVLVRAKNGSAENYYYLQAGELQGVDLYKYDVKTSLSTGITYEDTITLNTGDIVAVSRPSSETINSLKYRYYALEEYQRYIRFEVIGDENIYEISGENNDRIIIGLSPNASKLQIVIYTMYGEIATITVNVNAYYSAARNTAKTIYSGTELSLSDVVVITDNFAGTGNSDVTKNAQLLGDQSGVSMVNYTITEDLKIRFVHSETNYVIENLAFYVSITSGSNTYTYLCSLANVTVYANITSIKPAGEVSTPSAEPIVENSGNIEISTELWDNLFVFNDLANAYNVSYKLIYNEPIELIKLEDTQVPIGVLIGSETIQIEFQVILNNEITISALASIKIQSNYSLKINYPKANDSSLFTAEYIQTGAIVDFTQETFNNVKRFEFIDVTTGTEVADYELIMRDASGAIIDASEGETIWDFADVYGNYTIEIVYNNNVYGKYNIVVSGNNPLLVTSSVNGNTFYAGYGADAVFNYVDITLDIPAGMNIATGQTFNIVAILADNTEIMLLENIYYSTNEDIRSYRIAVEIAKYNRGITPSNIYVSYAIEDGEAEKMPCYNVSITERFSISYNGEKVASKYYPYIIELNTTGMSSDGKSYTYELPYNSKASNVSQLAAKITGEYTVNVDFALEATAVNGVHLTLNANEYPAGLSLVELFNLSDNFGKEFWYNHVGTIGGLDAELTLSHKTVSSSSNSILLEADYVEGTDYIYDYKIKAMGAANNGTIVTLVLTYSVGNTTYLTELNIKVISDIVVNVLNGDGNATANSESNPLVLDVAAAYKLVDSTQVSSNNDLYYIWVYGKYDTTMKNVAKSMYDEDRVSGIGNDQVEFATITNASDLTFNYTLQPTFGDKLVIITFVDNYGYTFAYYIKLVAQKSVANVSVLQDAYYEGGIINIYNKNRIETNLKGIVLDLRNINNSLAKDDISIYSVSATVGTQDVTTGILAETGNQILGRKIIRLKNPSQEFWSYGNGQSVTVVFTIKVYTDDESQTYEFARSFSIRKKYELSVKEENTYVRDGVEFSAEQIVSVYDYENSTYLGEPTITSAETIKLDFAINQEYTINASFAGGEVEINNQKDSLIITATGLSLFDLMKIAKGQLDETYYFSCLDNDVIKLFKSNGEQLNQTESFNINKSIVINAILAGLDIETSNEEGIDFSIALKVMAKSKSANSEPVYGKVNAKLIGKDVNNDGVVDIYETTNNNFVYLGDHQEIFSDSRVNKTLYDFEVYLMQNVVNEGDVCVAKTGDSSYTMTGTIITQKREQVDNAETAIDIAKFKTIYVLKVAVAKEVGLILNVDTSNLVVGDEQLMVYTVTPEKKAYYLEENEYQDKIIDLYTGAYVEDNGYRLPNAEDKADVIKFAYKGLTTASALDAKSLDSVSLKAIDNTETVVTVCNLTEDGVWHTDGGIDYQRVDTIIEATFKYNVLSDDGQNVSGEATVTYQNEETIRTTLYYTGVDTSSAYVATGELKEVELFVGSSSGAILGESQEGGAIKYIVNGELKIDIATWSQGFELIPGTGYAAIRAKYSEVNFGFDETAENAVADDQGRTDSNVDKLVFTLKSVTGAAANAGTLVSWQGTALKLADGFKLNEYFITIGVSCKYPSPDGEEVIEIAELYIGFKVNAGTAPA